ncbi:MAG: UDP-3-O-(3-hydroxymyristoyl)glucosamine N-acyltransferase [Litorimonas sp.]
MIDPRFFALVDGGLSLAELCETLGLDRPDGTFGEVRVEKPAPLPNSLTGDVSFLESKRHLSALETAKASACFVTADLAQDVAARHIVPLICDAPKYELARATDLLVAPVEDADLDIDETAFIHPTAVIEPGVVIGAHSRIGPHSTVSNAVIGEGVSIGSCTVIGGSGFGVVSDGQGTLLPVPHVGRVVIGDRVRIGSNSCVDRGQLGDTVVADGCQIDNLVQIAHNVVMGKNCIVAGRVGISGSCIIGTDVMMGGGSGLADHITIGDGARLAAFAGVMHDVPAGETWSGIPAMPIRQHMKMLAVSKRAIRK